MTSKDELKEELNSIRTLPIPERNTRKREFVMSLPEISTELTRALIELYVENPEKFLLDILLQLGTKLDKNILFEIEEAGGTGPAEDSLVELLIGIKGAEDLDRMFEILNKSPMYFLDNIPSILKILQEIANQLVHKNDIVNWLLNGVKNCNTYQKREDCFRILNHILSNEQKSEFYGTLFDVVTWGVQRLIVQEYRHLYEYDLVTLVFYLDLLGKRGLNFGVRYDLWNSIFILFQHLKDQINNASNKQELLRHFNTCISKEDSTNVIVGYRSDFSGNRYGGIVGDWLNLAEDFPEILESLVNHDRETIFESVLEYIRRADSYNERFALLRTGVGFLNRNEPRISRMLSDFIPFAQNAHAEELVEYLINTNHKSSPLYYKALLLKETDQPFLSAKFGIVGAGQSGKTTLVYYLVNNAPLDNTSRTYGIELQTILLPNIEGIKEDLRINPQGIAEIKLYDFGGQNFFWAAHKFFFQKIKGFMTVFNAADDGVIPAAEKWVARMEEHYQILPPIFLVRTKMDLSAQSLTGSKLEFLKSKSSGEVVYEVWSKIERGDKSNLGKGIAELREALFRAVDWDSLQKYNLTGEMLEILKFIKDIQEKKTQGAYILKTELQNLVAEGLPDINPGIIHEEFEKSLIKMEEDGDLIVYAELVILQIELFSQLISQICQEAQNHNGIIAHDDVYRVMFTDVFPEEQDEDKRFYLIHKILSILINKESCFPDYIGHQAVYVFYEDIQEDFPVDRFYGQYYDFMTWIQLSSKLQKGNWEKMLILISLVNGFHVNSIWQGAISLSYKYHQVLIRKIETDSSLNPLIIEILIQGSFTQAIGVEIQALIMNILNNNLLIPIESCEISEYYQGSYEFVCRKCGQIIPTKDWISKFIKHGSSIGCRNCDNENEMVKFENVPRILKQEDVYDLYSLSRESYSLFVNHDYEDITEKQAEYLDQLNENQQNHLDEQLMYQKLLHFENPSIGISLIAQKAILPDVSTITACSENDLESFYKCRAKGTSILKKIYDKVLRKLRLKTFLKINFNCRNCGKTYPFLLVLHNEWTKYIRLALFIALKIAGITASSATNSLADVLDEDIDVKGYVDRAFENKANYDIAKFPQEERELLVKSLQGFDSIVQVFDAFPKVAHDPERNESYLVCFECCSEAGSQHSSVS